VAVGSDLQRTEPRAALSSVETTDGFEKRVEGGEDNPLLRREGSPSGEAASHLAYIVAKVVASSQLARFGFHAPSNPAHTE